MDIKYGTLVKIISGPQEGSIGMVTKFPTLLNMQKHYTVITEAHPYGQWLDDDGFIPLQESADNNDIKLSLFKERASANEYDGYIPLDMDPYEFFIEMAEIDPKYNTDHNIRNGFRVWIYPNEGPVPHVHVAFKHDAEAYVNLANAAYTDGHKKKTKILTPKEKQSLQKFFESKSKSINDSGEVVEITNWRRAVDLWVSYLGNDRNKIEVFKKLFDEYNPDFEIPDYTEL